MNIIDETYFEVDGLIGIEYANGEETLLKLETAIAKYVSIFMKQLLGYELARNVMAYDNEILPIAPNALFDAILDGIEFTNQCGVLCEYEGVRKAVANYVFYYYKVETVTSSGDFGEKQLKTDNSVNASSEPRMREAWNQMLDSNRILYSYMQTKFSDYPTFEAHSRTEQFISLLTPKLNRYGF